MARHCGATGPTRAKAARRRASVRQAKNDGYHVGSTKPSLRPCKRGSIDTRRKCAFAARPWLGSTHFQMKTLKHVGTEMALYVLAYNMRRVISLLGAGGLIEGCRA